MKGTRKRQRGGGGDFGQSPERSGSSGDDANGLVQHAAAIDGLDGEGAAAYGAEPARGGRALAPPARRRGSQAAATDGLDGEDAAAYGAEPARGGRALGPPARRRARHAAATDGLDGEGAAAYGAEPARGGTAASARRRTNAAAEADTGGLDGYDEEDDSVGPGTDDSSPEDENDIEDTADKPMRRATLSSLQRASDQFSANLRYVRTPVGKEEGGGGLSIVAHTMCALPTTA